MGKVNDGIKGDINGLTVDMREVKIFLEKITKNTTKNEKAVSK